MTNPAWQQRVAYHRDKRGHYILDAPIAYWSKRYKKWVKCPIGMRSDGASGPAEDIVSIGWWIHDQLCATECWDDGTPCTGLQRSTVLYDILRSEGRWFRARSWFLATGARELYLWARSGIDRGF